MCKGGRALATDPHEPAIVIGAPAAILQPSAHDLRGGITPDTTPGVTPGMFSGSLEEIYLKNVSTEAREAYIYTDNVRPNPAEKVFVRVLFEP